MRTEQEQREWEINCYGCTKKDLEKEYEEHAMGGGGFYAICILSDVQELMAMASAEYKDGVNNNYLEMARKLTNKAKFFINYKKGE